MVCLLTGCVNMTYRINCRVLVEFVCGLALLCGLSILPHSTSGAEPQRPSAGDGAEANPPPDAAVEVALRDDFLVLPIRTDLQHAHGKKYEKAKVLVLINAMKAIRDEGETLDAKALKLQKIWEALTPYSKGEPGNVVFRVWCPRFESRSDDDGSWPATSILMDALEQFGHDIGFPEAGVDMRLLESDHKYTGNWEQAVMDFADRPGEVQLDESPVGDRQVRCYPVRTRLSRLLYGETDCVIHIVPPIDDVNIATAIKTMTRVVPQLDLRAKDKVTFLNSWKSPEVAEAMHDALMGAHVYHDMLGFADAVWIARN